MPAEDCAAGFAYTIVNAKEHHGQIADPFAPLMKFGLTPSALRTASEQGGVSILAEQTGAVPSLERRCSANALECAVELETILETVSKEFNEQGAFARRWGLRDFQKKTGMSVKDWLQTATDVITKLKSLDDSLDTGDMGEVHRLQGQLLSLQPLLERLANYFKSTMKDAKGFIKDPEALSAALEALTYREHVVHSLVSALEKINE